MIWFKPDRPGGRARKSCNFFQRHEVLRVGNAACIFETTIDK